MLKTRILDTNPVHVSAIFCDNLERIGNHCSTLVDSEEALARFDGSGQINATSGNFDNTRYGNPLVNSGLGSNPYASSAAMLYEKAVWLVTRFGSHSGDYVSLQYALWNLMSPKNASAGSRYPVIPSSLWMSYFLSRLGVVRGGPKRNRDRASPRFWMNASEV